MGSLKKLLDLVPKTQATNVKEEVCKALLLSGDHLSRNTGLSQLSGKGLDKELACAILDIVIAEESFVLLSTDLLHIREYIGLLGSDSAIALFEQYATTLADGIEKKYSRFVVY